MKKFLKAVSFALLSYLLVTWIVFLVSNINKADIIIFGCMVGLLVFLVFILKKNKTTKEADIKTKSFKGKASVQEENLKSKAFQSKFNAEDFIIYEAKKIDNIYLQPKKDLKDISHFFYGKKVVITGGFESFPFRNEMARFLWEVGADVDKSVGKHTDISIVGNSGVGPKKMEQIIAQDITIMREDEFLKYFPNSTVNKFKNGNLK